MRRHALAAAMAIAFIARAGVARAACTDAGACAANQYCATARDGGAVVTDGGGGVCLPEPCVVSSDCPAGDLCDTSEVPFACVPAPPSDAGPDAADASAEASDGGGEDAAPSAIDAGPAADAGNETDASPEGGTVDTGTLDGGACDCSLGAGAPLALGPAGAPFALALVFARRRRARRRSTSAPCARS